MIKEGGGNPPLHFLTPLLTLIQLPCKSILVPPAIHWDGEGREWVRHVGRNK